MIVDYKNITENIFIPMLKKLGFHIKYRSKYKIVFFYKDNQLNQFIIEKDNIENAVGFFFRKPYSGVIEYALRNIILIVCDEPYKTMHENAPEKYYYDTNEELIGIFDFAYGIISNCANDFYCGDLTNKMHEDFIARKKQIKKKNKDEKEEFMRIFQYMNDWKKVRFTERHYL